jgi:hypothetical protein
MLVLSAILDGGFTNAISRSNKLNKSGVDEVWIFCDGGVWAALRVPGDGRAQTFDVALVMTAISNPRPDRTMQSRWLAEALQRYKIGESKEWS